MVRRVPSLLHLYPAFLWALAIALAGTAAAQAQSAPCAPTFAALHDFKVGDIFQYRIWKRDGQSGTLLSRATETIRKYRILSRTDSGGIRAYRITGLARTSRLENGTAVSSDIAPIEETLLFPDSAGHRLNRCQDDIVPLPEAGFPDTHTRLRIATSDGSGNRVLPAGTKMKILGQVIGTRVGDTALSPILDGLFTLAYAEGLGLVERVEGGGFAGVTYSETLMGYFRDGETHGELAADLMVVLSVRPAAGRAHGRAVSGWPLGWDAAAFDLRGRRVPIRGPAL